MRLVIISDSHGHAAVIERILLDQPTAVKIFFLGDTVSEIESIKERFTDRRFYIVSGNCDPFSLRPASDIASVGGMRIFYTHGHTLDVKYGTDRLLAAARARECGLALYGHTHAARITYEDGIYLVNPGSCACSREGSNSYAVIDIEQNGIMPVIVSL